MTKIRRMSAVIGGLLWLAAIIWAADALPRPDAPFKGKIDPGRDKSTPDWPSAQQFPKARPT
ncbi:MAG: hypothetical protein ABSG65_09620 [Bryobacteraceae bacterium]|jgi:hypothetical protein